MPKDTVLDFSHRFLSDALTDAEAIPFLNAEERLMLNHIRSNSYAHLFLFLEEYAVALAAQRASLELHGNATHMRALLRFTEEELKHQQLFARFTGAFARGGARSSLPCSTTTSRWRGPSWRSRIWGCSFSTCIWS